MDARGRERADIQLPDPDFIGRWTAARKEAVVMSVLGGVLSLEEALRRYRLTIEEYNAWQLAYARKGREALKARKVQENRQQGLFG